MIPNSCSKIIRREPGSGTGDEYCQTKDGCWWRPLEFIDRHHTTGETYGYEVNGVICKAVRARWNNSND